MWSSLLGALAMLGMVLTGLILIPGAPKLIDAISDRIRYGVQNPAESGEEDDDLTEEDEEAPVATTTPRKVHAA